jgi:hypothetical protein
MLKTLITFVIAACGFIGVMDYARAAGFLAPADKCGAKPAYVPEGVTTECLCGTGYAGWGVPATRCSWIFTSK